MWRASGTGRRHPRPVKGAINVTQTHPVPLLSGGALIRCSHPWSLLELSMTRPLLTVLETSRKTINEITRRCYIVFVLGDFRSYDYMGYKYGAPAKGASQLRASLLWITSSIEPAVNKFSREFSEWSTSGRAWEWSKRYSEVHSTQSFHPAPWQGYSPGIMKVRPVKTRRLKECGAVYRLCEYETVIVECIINSSTT